jgi:conjugal transfer/entry exclusion protein
MDAIQINNENWLKSRNYQDMAKNVQTSTDEAWNQLQKDMAPFMKYLQCESFLGNMIQKCDSNDHNELYYRKYIDKSWGCLNNRFRQYLIQK